MKLYTIYPAKKNFLFIIKLLNALVLVTGKLTHIVPNKDIKGIQRLPLSILNHDHIF